MAKSFIEVLKDNFGTPDDPTTVDEKLDRLLSNDQSGFVVPSSKSKRVNLSGSTQTQALSQAARSKALGFDLQAVQDAANRVGQSTNLSVAPLRGIGMTTGGGPRMGVASTGNIETSPGKPRPRPSYKNIVKRQKITKA
jgi:hypothetical protein